MVTRTEWVWIAIGAAIYFVSVVGGRAETITTIPYYSGSTSICCNPGSATCPTCLTLRGLDRRTITCGDAACTSIPPIPEQCLFASDVQRGVYRWRPCEAK